MKNAKRNFLGLPDSFEANNIPKGSEIPSGIIKQIKNEVTDITSYVYPSYGGTLCQGDIKTLVNWDNFVQVYKSGMYLQVWFKHGFVYPTSYSIKGTSKSKCYATEWTLYGFNTAEEEMTILGEDKSEGTTFCNSGKNDCESNNWATFSVRKVTKAFKYFRMIDKSCSCNYDDFLLLGGFELFGLYSIDGRILSDGKRKKLKIAKNLEKLPFSLPFLISEHERCSK